VVELGLRSERPGSRKYKSGEARARVDGNTCGLWRAWQFPFSIPCGTPKTCRPGWQGKRRWIASSRLGLARWPARHTKSASKQRGLRQRRSVLERGMFETYRCRSRGNRRSGRLLAGSLRFTRETVKQVCSTTKMRFKPRRHSPPIPVQFHPLDPASELVLGSSLAA